MTDRDLTRSLIYLNLNDVDGLIDIARTGLDPDDISPLTKELIERLANAIITPIAPPGFFEAPRPIEDDDDNPTFIFEGRIAMAVWPLEPLAELPGQPQTPHPEQAAQPSMLAELLKRAGQ